MVFSTCLNCFTSFQILFSGFDVHPQATEKHCGLEIVVQVCSSMPLYLSVFFHMIIGLNVLMGPPVKWCVCAFSFSSLSLLPQDVTKILML